jgi:hypothetical protein
VLVEALVRAYVPVYTRAVAGSNRWRLDYARLSLQSTALLCGDDDHPLWVADLCVQDSERGVGFIEGEGVGD